MPPSAQTLQQIARASGGEFFTASNDKRLGDVYDAAALAARAQAAVARDHRRLRRRLAALLLLAGGALSALWFRRVP